MDATKTPAAETCTALQALDASETFAPLHGNPAWETAKHSYALEAIYGDAERHGWATYDGGDEYIY